MKTGNKVVWLALVFAFAWTENSAIAKDRIEANGREKALFDTAQDTAKKTEATLNSIGSLTVQVQSFNSAQQDAIKKGNFALAGQIEKQKNETQTLLDAKLRQNRYSSYTAQNLWDESGNIATDLNRTYEGWRKNILDSNSSAQDAKFSGPKSDDERKKIQQQFDDRIPGINARNRVALGPGISTMFDLRDEMLSRLRGVMSDSQNDEIYAKLKTDSYTPEDVHAALVAFDSLRKQLAEYRYVKTSN